MSTETIICYWSGEEPTPPCPTLDAMPAYVDVVPLAFVKIDDNYQVNFDFLCSTHPPSKIQEWIKKVRANGTKVLFSIQDDHDKLGQIPEDRIDDFVANVALNVSEWGVDGVDLDYEPPGEHLERLITVTTKLRNKLGPGALLTGAIYEPWEQYPLPLSKFAAQLNFVTTMDYTPYQGLTRTKDLTDSYVLAVGTPGKVAIGVSCMGPPAPPPANFTPLDDVVQLCRWEPAAGQKRGIMLYTFSYDVYKRPATKPDKPDSGTGLPDGTFTKTIHEELP
jgi:hypothetical protein